MSGSELSPSLSPDHPRRTAALIGHAPAESAMLAAWRSGRLPHAWLLGGPRGVGKATLAFRFARFILAQPLGDPAAAAAADLQGTAAPAAGDLAVPPEHPVFQRIAAGGHADLLTVERSVNDKTGRLRGEITVDDVRRLPAFFTKTAGEGGYRLAIVDAADEMNRNAANALLKILEEPPPRAVILIVAHAPGSLLPTIRSRCRQLTLRPLGETAVVDFLGRRKPDLAAAERLAVARLAEGSPGRALSLAELGGPEVYRELIAMLARLPEPDVGELHAFAERLARRENEGAYRLTSQLIVWWLARLIQSAAAPALLPAEAAAGEGALLARLASRRSLDRWLDVWEKVNRLIERAESVNLDRKQVMLNIFFALGRAARG